MDDGHSPATPDNAPEARFGAVLRQLRERAGLTLRDLGEQLHRSHSTISDFEHGRRLPGVEVVEQYEDRFGLSPGMLVVQRERARATRLDNPRDATLDQHLAGVACPYKGLQAFEREDAALFFGREVQVERVLSRLAEVRFVAIVGASGSGKSSFMRAGLLAHAADSPSSALTDADIALLTPGARPLEALAAAVNRATGDAGGIRAADLRRDPEALERATSDAGALVLAIDALEELFTMCRDEAERACFVEALMAAWRDPSSPVVVILALRADAYERITAYPELAEAVVAHQTLLAPPGPVDLRRVIELPAARAGLVLQAGLAQTMLDDLAGEPGALPLISHALLETWKRRSRLTLTVAGYLDAGGVRGAIARTAELTLQRLATDERAVARVIFLSLTDIGEGTEPTSRRVERSEIVRGPAPAPDGVLAILADARLVSLEERTVAVAHEALIRHWPRLRGWIEADRAGLLVHRRLTEAAREWNVLDRDQAALYRGARLAAAAERAAEHPELLNELERDFVAAGEAAEQRRARRLRALAIGLALVTLVVTALAVWALDQRSTAQSQRSDARRQAREASSLALASASTPLLHSRPDVALLLGMEAVRLSPRPEARSSALGALVAARAPGVRAMLRGHEGIVEAVVFSPDRRTLAAAGADRTIRLWDVRTHRTIGPPLRGHADTVRSLAFSPDGRTLASGGDTKVRLWDVATRRPVGGPLGGFGNGVGTVAFGRDGRTLAAAAADRGVAIRLWNAHTRKPVGRRITAGAGWIRGIAFHPDGRTLASLGTDGTLRLRDIVGGRPARALPGRYHANSSLTFSADGRTLAVNLGDRGTVRLWDVRTRRPLGRVDAGRDTLSAIAFSPGGGSLATSSGDRGAIRLWDVRPVRPRGRSLTRHGSLVASLAFDVDGRTLASGGVDGTIRLQSVHDRSRLGEPLTGHRHGVMSVAFSPDGRMLAGGEGIRMVAIGPHREASVAVRVWDVGTGRQIGRPLRGHKDMVLDIAFAGHGRTLAAVGWDGTIRVWDVDAHKQIGQLMAPRRVPLAGGPVGIALSPDGRTLASASVGGGVRLSNVAASTHVDLARAHTSFVGSPAISRDGRTLAVAGYLDHRVRFWDVRTHARLRRPLRGRDSFGGSLAFSPDGRMMVVDGPREGTGVRLWDARTGRAIGAPLSGPETGSRMIFSPDGRTLLSADADGMLRLLDLTSRQPLGPPLRGQAGSIGDMAFSPDGRTLAASGSDRTVRVWRNLLWRNFGELRRQVCALVGNGLSRAEWARFASGIAYHEGCPER